MIHQKVRDFVVKSYAARRREDVEGVLETFHPDAKFRIVADKGPGQLGTRLRGHEELRSAFQQIFATWDWSAFEINQLIVDGPSVAVRSSGQMVHTPTRTEFEFETADFIKMKDGKIFEFTEFLDTLALSRTVDFTG